VCEPLDLTPEEREEKSLAVLFPDHHPWLDLPGTNGPRVTSEQS
jgi:hypothetical protein